MLEPSQFTLWAIAAWLPCALINQEPNQQLAAARSHLLRGRYEESLEKYAEARGREPAREAAAIGLSRCHEAVGDWEQASAVIEQGLEVAPEHPDLLARKAELAFQLGRWPEAAAACKTVLANNPNHVAALWTAARLDDASGKGELARRNLESIVRSYNRDQLKDPDTLVLIGRAVVDHASRTMRGREQSEQLNAALNDILDGAIAADPDYWPALLWSGRLFLEKFRKGDALADLQRALAINPRAAEIHVALGVAALNDYQIEAGHQHADHAIAINPNLPAARRLKADLFMAREQYDEAIAQLDQAMQVNPLDEETLGCLAACFVLLNRAGESDRLADEVRTRNPSPARFYHTLAEHLEDHRRFDLAEGHFRMAIQHGPDLSGPYTGLGMLFMRVGKEDEAAKILSHAFEMDPFNVRTKNMLEVLDQLSSYQTITTEHFHIKVDPQVDLVLGQYAGKYLEQTYGELTARFGYRPKDPIQIEIFNKGRGQTAHQWFSARTVGLPWIGTVGACTGKVVAMASPQGLDKPFNWARVLKHEVTHVITLQQTDFQIPHWFTEALAVQAEQYPRPQVWNQLLIERVPAGKLLNLDNINLAFARPKTALEWQLAYCQSELYAEYMQSRFGDSSTARLLAAYRDGLSTSAAIEKVFGVSKDDFEAGYTAHLHELTNELHAGPVDQPMSLAELERAVQEEPENPDLSARLAGEFFKKRNYPKCREMASKATRLSDHHPLGSYWLARLSLVVGDTERAHELLEPALNRQAPDPRVLELLADLETRAKRYDTARSLYELGGQQFPTESKWVSGAARIALLTEDHHTLREKLEQLCQLDAEDVAPRRKLASMAAAERDWMRAVQFASMTLHIDVLDAEAHSILAQAYAAQERWRDAVEEYLTLQALHPDDDSIPLKLARAQKAAGDREGAIQTARKALEKNPESREAQDLLRELSP